MLLAGVVLAATTAYRERSVDARVLGVSSGMRTVPI
jgi:hypothetical protein